MTLKNVACWFHWELLLDPGSKPIIVSWVNIVHSFVCNNSICQCSYVCVCVCISSSHFSRVNYVFHRFLSQIVAIVIVVVLIVIKYAFCRLIIIIIIGSTKSTLCRVVCDCFDFFLSPFSSLSFFHFSYWSRRILYFMCCCCCCYIIHWFNYFLHFYVLLQLWLVYSLCNFILQLIFINIYTLYPNEYYKFNRFFNNPYMICLPIYRDVYIYQSVHVYVFAFTYNNKCLLL